MAGKWAGWLRTRRPRWWLPTQDGVRPATVEEAAAFNDSPAACLARDREGELIVSTIFLCLDHQLRADPNAAPILWETMVFGVENAPPLSERRYASREDALAGHAEWCRLYLGRAPREREGGDRGPDGS